MLAFDLKFAGLGRFSSISARSVPYAIAATLSRVASVARADAKENLRREFILRNRWMEGSIRADFAKPSQLVSRVGSLQAPLALQELGGNRAIKHAPTGEASGEGRVEVRRRAVRPSRKINRLEVAADARDMRGGDKRARNRAALGMARKKGAGSYAMLELKQNWLGLVLVNKRGLRLMQIINKNTINKKLQPRPWLAPAAHIAAQGAQKYFEQALSDQLRRARR